MNKKTGFWGKFDELMKSIPDYIEEETTSQISSGPNSVNMIGSDNNVMQASSRSSSTSTIVQNGKTIVVRTVNGKTTITVNGKEYVEKGSR